MPHKTPRSLNDSLRLGRLTAPQWAACVVAGASLWVCSGLAFHVADLNAHLLAVVLPTMLLVTPILILWRGGVERYPAQLLRFRCAPGRGLRGPDGAPRCHHRL